MIVNLLGISVRNDPMVWIPPTPFTALRTLNLEFNLSTFRTLTCSVPIPRISLGTIEVVSKSPPLTVKNVTIPVTVVAPTETPVVPVPTILNDSLLTPMVYEPSICDDVVDIPDIVTISRSCKECGVFDSTL